MTLETSGSATKSAGGWVARKLLLGWVLLGVGVLGFPLASHVAASHWSQSTGTEAEPVLQASLFGEPRRQDSRPAVPDIDTPNPEQEAAAVRAASDFLKQPGLLDTARGRFDIETVGSISDESGLIGLAVVLTVPDAIDLGELELIDARRDEAGRYVSTPYKVEVTNLRSLVVLVDLDGNVFGASIQPMAGESRPEALIRGPIPSVPEPGRFGNDD